MSYYEKVYPSYLRVPSIKQLRLYVLKYQKGSILPILNMFKFMVVLLTSLRSAQETCLAFKDYRAAMNLARLIIGFHI